MLRNGLFLLFWGGDACTITTSLCWATWNILSTCRNRYVVVKKILSPPRFHLSESVVFHLVYWMSSFLSCLVYVYVWSLFCFCIWKTSDFLRFTLFSYNLRIVDRPQDVLMTVRASSAHGMSYEKSYGMDCFGTHFTHVQTRVSSATECILRYILYTCPNLQCNPCSKVLRNGLLRYILYICSNL